MMRAVRQSQLFNSGIFTPMLTLFIATHVVWAQTWTQTCAPTNGWRCIASSADGSKVVAGQWPGTIYISTNSGATWAPSTAPNESWTSVASSADGCKLLAAAGNSPYPGGVFTSTNSGTAWISNSLPSMYWSSVASSADGNSLVAVAPYGESGGIPGAVFTSTNGGINLMSNTLNNPSGVTGNFPLGVAASADGRKMVVVEMFDVESPSSVFRSTDSGTTWTQETNSPTIYGSASPSQYIASSADGTKLALCVFVGTNGNPGPIYVSTNSGDTWNLTSAPNNEWGFVTMSANGDTIVAVPGFYQDSEIYISTNTGNTWITNGPILSWGAVATSADGGKLAAAAAGDANFDFADGPIYLSQSVVAPQMAIGPANGGVQLSWLVPSTNFVLQQSIDLSDWADTTNCAVLNPDNLQDEVMIQPTNAAGFYRLKTP